MLVKVNNGRQGWKGICSVGLQVGSRTFLDTGATAHGVFGLVGWEEPCHEPIAVRCQLAINGKPAPYYWLACANPLHQRDAWIIEHLDSDGNVTHTTQGIRMLEETNVVVQVPLSYEKRWHTPTATPIKVRKPRKKKVPKCSIDVDIVTEPPTQYITSNVLTDGRSLTPEPTKTSKRGSKNGKRKSSV